MTITVLPTAPSRAEPSTFSVRGDALLGALATFVTEANAQAAGLNAIAAGTAVGIPYTFSTTTTDSDPGSGFLRLDNATQNTATTIRADLIGSDGSTWTDVLMTFDDSTSTIKGYIILQKLADGTKWLLFSISALASPSGYKNITVAIVGSSATNPFANNDSIILKFTRTGDKGSTGAGNDIVRSARTSDTILANDDQGTLIDVTSGTFTQTFTAAATLTDGWWCYYRNSGTGDVTLNPDGAETIDGLTTFVMYPGEARLIQCTGTAFFSVVLSPFYRAFITTETFTKPPGYSAFGALLWSGGMSGEKRTGVAARGGAAGGCFQFTLLESTFGATETVTVGAGGASQTTNDTAGNNGGNTTIGTLANVVGSGPTNGGCVGGDSAIYKSNTGDPSNNGFGGGTGNAAIAVNTIWGGATGPNDGSVDSGSSIYGGAAGGGHNDTTARAGGTSVYGGNGGAASVTGNGVDGTAPSGGGGACKNTGNSGAGARGEVRIWGKL